MELLFPKDFIDETDTLHQLELKKIILVDILFIADVRHEAVPPDRGR
jgi:hypothetical protein